MQDKKKSKKKKVVITILSIISVIIIGCVILLIQVNRTLSSFNEVDFASLDLSKVEDGTYTGSADGSIVKATVEVTVKDHIITDVTILSHDNGKGKPAEVIVEDIVEKNSLEVDAISGATHSSNIIKTAVLNALTK